MEKYMIYLIIGIMLIIIGLEQLGAYSSHWHTAVMPWISGIIVLFGIYLIAKAWDKRKKIKKK